MKAYAEMFEVAVSRQSGDWRTTFALFIPLMDKIFVSFRGLPRILLLTLLQPDKNAQFVAQCQEVIKRVAGRLIQEKKRKMAEAEEKGQTYQGKDLLSLLCM